MEDIIQDTTPQPEKTEELEKFMMDTINYHLKQYRNKLLQETDKYILPDFPITPENLIKIKEYRQALRDFTNNNYILPDKPDFVS